MSVHPRHRLADEHGGPLLESVIAVMVLALFGMGALTLTQAFLAHHDLANAVRSGARYATRADYDPSADPPSSSRRRNEAAVRQFVADGAGATDVAPEPCDASSDSCVDVTVPGAGSLADALPGDDVVVTARAKVDNGLWTIGAKVTNAFAGVLGQGEVLDPDGITIGAEAVAILE